MTSTRPRIRPPLVAGPSSGPAARPTAGPAARPTSGPIAWLIACLALVAASGVVAGTICGTVTDLDTGLPIAGAGVFVRQPPGAYAGAAAVSAGDGTWCIDDVAAGTYTLEFRVDDYVTAYANDIVVTDTASDVPVSLARTQVVLDPPWPNPAASAVKLRLHVAEETPVSLEIYDARGRLVRHWTAASVGPGTRNYDWDGRDAAGRRAPTGLYLIRVRSAAATSTRSLILTH